MIWALYLLARNPQVQQEVALELATSAPEAWMTHSLLRTVMRETLRLYPAAPFLTRALAVDTELGGYNVPAGVSCLSCLYCEGI